jgi:hypothetical protein
MILEPDAIMDIEAAHSIRQAEFGSAKTMIAAPKSASGRTSGGALRISWTNT